MDRDGFRETLERRPAAGSPSFIEYFGACLTHMRATYDSLNRRLPAHRRAFDATGVASALEHYAWPAQVARLHPHPRTQDVIEFEETSRALSHYRNGLRTAMANDGDVSEWTRLILRWGMGARGESAQAFIDGLGDAPAYLRQVDAMSDLNGDTDHIDPDVVRYYNSGLSKIHSLASGSGLVIYDSRVAFAIGECVCEWAASVGLEAIPTPLRFMQAGRRAFDAADDTMRRPRGHGDRYRHPVIIRDHRWLETQMRASWLFEAALEDAADLWPDDDMLTRMHKLEAAFFMFGAYAGSLVLPQVA